MKKILIAILLFASTIKPQEYLFGVVSNFQYSELKKTQLDSIIKRINSNNELSTIFFTGSLTEKGTKTEFLSFKNSLDSIKTQYILLPYGNDTRDVSGWETFLDFSGDDKFAFNSNGYLFIGINPTLPYTNTNTFSPEGLTWLEQLIDTVKLSTEIYFLTPIPFQNIPGWQYVFDILKKKNLKAIINCNAKEFNQKNILGIISLELLPDNFIFTLTTDQIIINSFDDKHKLIINKSIGLDIKSPAKDNFINIDFNQLLNINAKTLTYTSPLYWSKNIYTASYDGIVSCYDTTGQLLWDYNTFGNIIGTPVIADRIIAITTIQGDLITLSAITGEQIQTIGFEERITTSLCTIDYTGSKILMIPKLTDSKTAILFGTSTGKLYCYDLETLQEYWINNNAKGMIRSKPISVNNKIFFTADDGFLYCIDARNGLLIWRWKEKADTDFSNSSIETDGKKVFVISADGILYAIDNLLGKLVWKNERNNSFQKFYLNPDKVLICKGKDSKIYFVDSETGKNLRDIKFDEQFDNSSAGIIYSNGNLLFLNNASIYKSLNFTKPELIYLNDYYPFNSLEKIDSNRFIASKYNGSIIIFRLR